MATHLNEAQLATVLNARLVLLTAPPEASLACAIHAMRRVGTALDALKDQGKRLPPEFVAVRDATAQTLASIQQVPDEVAAFPSAWQPQLAWLCEAVLTTSPGGPAGLAGFVEQLLVILMGTTTPDPELTALQQRTGAETQRLAKHLLQTYDKLLPAILQKARVADVVKPRA